MSDEEIIKAIEERANKLGIKINLSYDFGSGRSDDAHMTPRGRTQQRAPFDFISRAMPSGAMTAQGSAVFGAQWKTIEAKIVEVPAIANALRPPTTSSRMPARPGLTTHHGRRSTPRGSPPDVAAAKCPSSGTERC